MYVLANQSPTVVVVDDESDVRHSLRLVIEAMGLTVSDFESAADFLSYLDQPGSSQVACLVVDVILSDMNGLELVEQLNAAGRRFPFVVVTGHGGDALELRAKELGASAFLLKPFQPAQLQRMLNNALS